jgi:hypothetical protein
MPCEEHVQCVKRDVHGYCDACRFGEPPASFFLTEKGYRRCHPREKKMGSGKESEVVGDVERNQSWMIFARLRLTE